MEKIELKFNIGPIDDTSVYTGSFDFQTEDPKDEKQIIRILKVALKRLKVTKNPIVIGYVEVTHLNQKIFDIDIFRAGKIQKNYITRL